jgi:hypothetical protein
MDNKTTLRQLVDWRAAFIAGIAAAIVFLLANMWLTSYFLGNPWVIVRLNAALIMGKSVLPPATGFDAAVLLSALAVHIPLSIAFACLIAFCLHRWGIVVGIVGGALFGLALYAIDFYTIATWFPWFTPMRSWIMAASHVLFGAVAGGVYEALEVERYERVAAPNARAR